MEPVAQVQAINTGVSVLASITHCAPQPGSPKIMLSFRLGTTLLLAATCSLMTAVSTERVITCSNGRNVQRLICDIGVIRVQAALYGRADNETCGERRPQSQLANTECSQEGTVDVLRSRYTLHVQ
ncbi:rhamnose-binding lectin-like isoform X2 [Anarrhichthys ocellatus]|uniref:rhamnose-binding lectin-like isoform X2 n=1 Tax=Anarrhichthys ocellatus TaxID=433405 RepID=UPI0012ED6916|nr:rhamnose-binding lectin-like isoform X2 [Anarrhichthys ocellatus]